MELACLQNTYRLLLIHKTIESLNLIHPQHTGSISHMRSTKFSNVFVVTLLTLYTFSSHFPLLTSAC